MRRISSVVGAALLLALLARDARPCPFCTSSGQTLLQEANSAGMILYGTPKNAKLDPKDFGLGTTDLEIETVIKSHEILAGRKVITLPKYIPQADPAKPAKFLVFCEVYKGQIDPYRGTPFKADSHIVPYLQGSLALKDKDIATRLKFFFDYLGDDDFEISNDAYNEFGNADYKDVKAIAEKLPAEKITGWISDPSMSPSRLGLYASLLGHCGKPTDSNLLKTLIEDPARRFTGGLDGVFAGLILLQPKEGWEYLAKTVGGTDKDKFLLRYSGLRAARFVWEYRPDLVKREVVAELVAGLVEQPDISDLAMEDLRKWGYWSAADRVLGVLAKPTHDAPIIRRSVLRFALKCPAKESAKAAAFVAEQKLKNPKWVEEVQSLLDAEVPPLAATEAGK